MGADPRDPDKAGLLHDLSNLLAGAARLAGSALRGLGPDHPAREDVAAIDAACRQGAEIVREIVDGAPGKGGHADLDAVAAEEVLVLGRTRGTPVRLLSSGEALRVRMAPTEARRVLSNLLLNASHAVDGTGGEIVVSVAKAGAERAILEVRDSGCGMAPPTVARVFERGFTTRPGEGKGLGLKIVKDLVEASGGEVSVTSAEGRGTSVRVLLPVAAPSRGSGTILLVDDHAGVRGSVRDVLRESGYRVVEAGDGRAALGLLDGVDLLLTDLRLPDMDGTDLAATAAATRPGLKIAFMSGYAWPKDPGAELLVKPTDPEELRDRIGALLRR
jgi:CheY-like chemotaxis protein/anti-sigma regulatory factor (Ser/Thr protein kinase)